MKIEAPYDTGRATALRALPPPSGSAQLRADVDERQRPSPHHAPRSDLKRPDHRPAAGLLAQLAEQYAPPAQRRAMKGQRRKAAHASYQTALARKLWQRPPGSKFSTSI